MVCSIPIISLFQFAAGFLSDRIVCIGERVRIIFFTALSMGTMSVCFILLAFFSKSHAYMAQFAFTLAIVASGLNSVGVTKSCQVRIHPVLSIHHVVVLISVSCTTS